MLEGREGGRALVRCSCSCVNHVGPYASFLRRAHASEIDRQPSLARSGVGRGRARSQPRTCHNQRQAASGGEGVEGRGGGGLMCHATAVPPRSPSHKHVLTAAKHHLNYL